MFFVAMSSWVYDSTSGNSQILGVVVFIFLAVSISLIYLINMIIFATPHDQNSGKILNKSTLDVFGYLHRKIVNDRVASV
mmetsp:Transcript_36515/g.97566  ORF Transcript_36515/g.97566 Transcript_36515/m.97566 type:complete len:80 (+) Transcript_36515:255-494(+)